MLCSECGQGKLRVLPYHACNCGHHLHACDNCLVVFMLTCGEPLGIYKQPTEYPLQIHTDFMDFQKKIHQGLSPNELKIAIELFRREVLASLLVEDYIPTLGMNLPPAAAML